jgi:hypothetical protein
MRLFRQGVAEGDSVALLNIGWMYREGLGVKRDYAEALRWLEKAGAQGNALAQDVIAQMYYEGQGVKQDYAAAMAWSLKAAGQSQINSQIRIGAMYLLGQGVKEDRAAALRWTLRAAEARVEDQIGLPAEVTNHLKARAQYTVGLLYERGIGTPKNVAQAISWYQSASALGSTEAPAKLAELQVSAQPQFDIVLWCDMGTYGSSTKTAKSLVSIDTKAKYVKIESQNQVMEMRDGVYGKIITSGSMAADAINLQQFVSIDGDIIKFGFKKNGVADVNSIDLRAGILRYSGQATECTNARR